MLRLALLAAAAVACAKPPPPAAAPEAETAPAAGPETADAAAAADADAEPKACTAAEGGDSFLAMRNEVVGGLKVGLGEAEVKRLVGAPGAVSGPVDNSAVGSWGWTWSYPDKGLELEMSAENKGDPKIVSAILVGKRSTLKTRFGIGVGSTLADVKRAYGPCISNEEGGDDRVVAGTIYGGVIFSIAGGAVDGIFVGAAAE